jgi:hypothetical protein
MDSLLRSPPVIQLAITPVILIAGMGALMITLTNRMARIVDRTRILAEADSGEREIDRVVGSGGSFGASSMRQEIGLGQAKEIIHVEIFWPRTGQTQVLSGLKIDHFYLFREGDAAAKEVAPQTFAWPSSTNAPAHHHHAMLPAAK